MEFPNLVILYGGFGTEINGKQQMMIDGICTCGYREYAKNFGHIVYLCPQRVSKPWEHCLITSKEVLAFIRKQPKNTIVWSVKHDDSKDKEVLKYLPNKKIYYSCCANNMYNDFADINLVDHISRVINKKCKLHLKGKDENYWKPVNDPVYDYLLIGKRADKNEIYFLERLRKEVNEKRRVFWIGGEKHKKEALNAIGSIHSIVCTPFSCQEVVRNTISQAKVGILYTEHRAEGFPQSFLEMTMCGVPVIYPVTAPGIQNYFGEGINCMLTDKKHIISKAEYLLKNHNRETCREYAVKNYSLKLSYEWMIQYVS